MTKRGVLRGLVFGTPAYVEAHARWKAKRGKNPSFTIDRIKNPKRALALAKQADAVDDGRGCYSAGADEYLSRSCVQQDGRIFPWGCIDLLTGQRCWSKSLLPYGTDVFYAQINQTSPTVVVRSRTDDQEVTSIPFSAFCVCTAWVSVVAPNGYLLTVGLAGDDGKFEAEPWRISHQKELVTALSNALVGKMPSYRDNSCFVRICPRYVGKEVVTIQAGGVHRCVLGLDGTVIKYQVHRPLALRRWQERLAG